MAENAAVPGLLRDLRRRWPIATAVAVAVVLGVGIYARSLPDEYRSEVVVSFSPKPQSGSGADTLRVVLPKYVAFVTAPATSRRLGSTLHVPLGKVASSVSASIGTDSGNLEVGAKTGSPSQSAALANGMASAVTSFAASDP